MQSGGAKKWRFLVARSRMDWRDGLEQQSKGEWETVEAEDSKALKWSSVEGVPLVMAP